jgi:tRNA threonylcarbamoyladenosine modification (KEOPS) complex  Pcc1 subunit
MSSSIVTGKSVIEIPLKSEETAEIILAALKPETRSSPSERATTHVSVKGRVLIIEIDAGDITALRAAMNSYIAWVSACIKSIEQIG